MSNHRSAKNQVSKHKAHQQAFESNQNRRLMIGILFYITLAICSWQGLLPWLVLAWYLVLGIVTFAMYAHDKRSAKNGGWRTPEKNLHLLAVLGGWIGAMLAQSYLRHKSQKKAFRFVYYLAVIVNLVVLVGLFWLLNFKLIDTLI